ncbi:MAG: hypothetical protein ABUL69_00875, partial [Peristeroidobacter soli]
MMDRDLNYAVLDAVAFITGAELSVMLGLMQWRVDRHTRRVSGYLLLWILGFIWTFGNFLRCTLEIAGVPPDATITKFAESFAWTCTVLGPIAMGRLLQASIGTTSRASRGFVALTIVVSLLNLGMLIGANYLHDWHIEASAYPTTSFYIALAVGIIALLLHRANRPLADPQHRSTPRWFAPAALSLAAIHASTIVSLTLFPGMPKGLMFPIGLIAQHWSIPWSILIAVSLAQAHFADVILKHSLWLLASAVLATLIGLRIATGLPQLMVTLFIAACMLSAPSLFRALERFVDRVIL